MQIAEKDNNCVKEISTIFHISREFRSFYNTQASCFFLSLFLNNNKNTIKYKGVLKYFLLFNCCILKHLGLIHKYRYMSKAFSDVSGDKPHLFTTTERPRKYRDILQCSLFVTPKFCISIVFSFSRGHFNSQEKLKIKIVDLNKTNRVGSGFIRTPKGNHTERETK